MALGKVIIIIIKLSTENWPTNALYGVKSVVELEITFQLILSRPAQIESSVETLIYSSVWPFWRSFSVSDNVSELN